MNDELKTKEYFKSIENIKLSDSSRDRIKTDLLTYARFHAAPAGGVTAAPKRSPLLQWLFSPVSAALMLVLMVGTTSVLLKQTTPAGQLALDDTQVDDSATPASEDVSATPVEKVALKPSTLLAPRTDNASVEEADDMSADTARMKVASESSVDTAFVASDEMSTMLSQGTWSIEAHAADITLRETTYQELIKKYDASLEADVKYEFKTKLDQAAALKKNIEGTSEEDARASLDKASVLIGEVEATLSTLGQVEIKDGVIVGVDFSVDSVE
jgi:hypothetical protein